jgi:hypothetical protein
MVCEENGDLAECLRFMLSINAARQAHSAEMDERRYLQWLRIMEAHEELFGKIRPRPPKDVQRSLEVRNQVFSSPKNAVAFSNMLAEAFKEAKVDLTENEIFECYICIREKPAYISEILLPSRGKGTPPMQFITNPGIMGQVMKILENDRVKP